MATKSTTDLYLAAAFLSLGAKIDHIDRENPKHMDFVFETHDPTPPANDIPLHTIIGMESKSDGTFIPFKVPLIMDLDDIEIQWGNGTLMVSATKYAESIRRMKSLVHSHS